MHEFSRLPAESQFVFPHQNNISSITKIISMKSISIFLYSLFPLLSCCDTSIEEISQSEFFKINIEKTFETKIIYYGYDSNYQYYSLNISKYKIPISEYSINEKDKFPFSSWERGQQVYRTYTIGEYNKNDDESTLLIGIFEHKSPEELKKEREKAIIRANPLINKERERVIIIDHATHECERK